MHYDVTYRLKGVRRMTQVEAPNAAAAVTAIANVYSVDGQTLGARAGFELLAVTPALIQPMPAARHGQGDASRRKGA